MQKIVPHLWYDKEAKEAALFYMTLMVACDSVEEVDAKWKALSEGGTVLMPLCEYHFSKDRFGLSWQIVSSSMNEMMSKGSKEEVRYRSFEPCVRQTGHYN